MGALTLHRIPEGLAIGAGFAVPGSSHLGLLLAIAVGVQNACEGLVMAAVLALTAVGLSLVFGVMRVVNVAHGEFFMLGAVLAWAVAHTLASPALGFLAALVVSPLAAALVAVALDRLVLRRLDYEPEAVIVATIGFGYVLQQGALSLYGPDARSVKELEKERAELIAEREKLVDRCVKTDDLGLKTSS